MKQPARDKACNRGGGGPPVTTRILNHCHQCIVSLSFFIARSLSLALSLLLSCSLSLLSLSLPLPQSGLSGLCHDAQAPVHYNARQAFQKVKSRPETAELPELHFCARAAHMRVNRQAESTRQASFVVDLL